jgi:hypothetical protein
VSAALENLFGSAEAFKSTERELNKRLHDRGIFFGDGLLPTYACAFLSPREQVARWAARAERFVDAAEQMAHRLFADVALCESMGLRRDILDVVLADPGYRRTCVVCRPDGIPVGTELKYVELNSDSPAMMMFLDVVAECLLELDAFAALRDQKPASTAERLLATLLDCYRDYGSTTTPTIAITDWEGQKTRFEHMRLAELFEARGYSTVVVDPRAFRMIDGQLRAKERKIDLVYRRALSAEVVARQDEVQPLLDAYRSGKICMVNPLRSYVVGVKSVLTELAAAVPDCVPHTVRLDTDDARELVVGSASRWVLKRSESHGGGDVIVPGVASDEVFRRAIDASRSEAWIAQEFLDVPRLSLPTAEGDAMTRCEKYYNWNPFILGGRYAGGMCRVSSTPLINITLGGGLLPTFCT